MMRRFCFLLVVAGLLLAPLPAASGQDTGGGPSAPEVVDLFSRGKFEYLDENFEAALDYLKRAYELEPESADHARFLGLTYEALGNLPQATALLKEAAALDSSLPGVWLELGRVHFGAGRYKEAIEALQRAERQEPERAGAYYYHGLALNKSGRYGDSPPFFEKAVSLEPRLGQTSYYYLGVAWFRTAQAAAARKAFAQAIEYDPDSKVADSSRTFLAAIERQQQRKPLRVWATLSFQYDDNVIQQPEGTEFQFAVLARNVGDWSSTAYLVADLRGLDTDKHFAGVSYSFYYNHYLELDHLDLLGNLLSAYAGWRPSPNLELRLNYAFQYYNLDYDNYLMVHEAAPSLVWRQTDQLLLQGYFSYKRRIYTNGSWNTGDFPVDDLDASNYSVGFLQHVLPFRDGNIYVGYRYDREAARAADFAYNGHQGTLGANSPSWHSTRAFAEVSYYARRYDARFRGTSTVRDDREWLITAGLTHDFNAYLQGTFRYLRFDNDSSVGVFRYGRNIYALSLTAVY